MNIVKRTIGKEGFAVDIVSKMYKAPIRFLEGVIVGLGGILPGISGGTLCAAFGMHKIFSECIARPFSNTKKHFLDLIFFIFGGVLGFVGLASASEALFDRFPAHFICMFAGMLLGTFPSLWKDAGSDGRGRNGIFCLAFSFLFFSALLYLLGKVEMISLTPNAFGFALCGVLWGLSILLPGLSASTAIMFLGLYQPMLEGISKMDFSILLPMAGGGIICFIFVGKAISIGYRKHYEILSHCTLGAVLATTGMLLLSADTIYFWMILLGTALSLPLGLTQKESLRKADFLKCS